MNQRNSIVNLFSGFMPDKWKQKIEEDAKRKVRLYNLIMLIFSLFGTAICIILLETNDQCDSIPSYICKSIVSVTTFCAIIFNYLEARHHRILKDAENNFVRGSDYYNKSRKRNFSLVFTSFILLIHPFPGVCMEIEIEEDVAKIQYRLDQLLMLLTLLRLGYIFRTVILYSKWDKAKGKQELEEKNITKSYYFIYKEMIEKNPFKAQMVILLISSAVCMIFLRFAEKPYEEHSGFDWSLWNTFYCVIITMTTVGYGDFYPSTFWGRVIGSIICVSGPLILTLFATTFLDLMKMTPQQEKAYNQTKRELILRNSKKSAVRVIELHYKKWKGTYEHESAEVIKSYLEESKRESHQLSSLRAQICANINISREPSEKEEDYFKIRREELRDLAQPKVDEILKHLALIESFKLSE